MDKLQRVLNGNDNSSNAENPSIMNEVGIQPIRFNEIPIIIIFE